MPVWDAIGAMARGRQVIVVGDPEQLPPTNVGQRGDAEDDDGATDPEPAVDPRRMRRLQPPPGPAHLALPQQARESDRLLERPLLSKRARDVPLARHQGHRRSASFQVRTGLYERGKGRVNRPEAAAVVAEVVNRLQLVQPLDRHRHVQRRAAETHRGHARPGTVGRPVARPVLAEDRSVAEPVFVKNLENVQGDEREVIIFSCAVGADATGRVTAQISSLNNEGGHRRLNVAITRARREMIVFSSMNPEQIDLGRTNSRGIIDFKHFLEFAKNGRERSPRRSRRPAATRNCRSKTPSSAPSKRKNWIVHPQVGVSYFRVDFGVVHPDKPGVYLAGVEADGAQFHRSATARDRDKLRQAALENLGWRILRIWSTEWWLDSNAALEKVHQRLLVDA